MGLRPSLVVVGLSLFGLTGCISQDEYNKIVADRDALRAEVSKCADDLDQERSHSKELQKALDEAKVAKPSRPPDAQIASTYAELKLGKGDTIRAIMHTTQGDINCELYPSIAPVAVLNFVGLAEGTKEWTDPRNGQKTTQPLYDGTKFHRVIKGFMVQGGDPLGTGRGGPGYTFTDEVWPDVRFDRPGVLAMANAGPGTNGSQFFITDSRPTHLNGRHTVFGLCDLETIRKIEEVAVGGDDHSTPIKDVVLTKLEIKRVPADQAATTAPQ
jgi:peptidyl-prolyl cis-trans isomerase A (cyclophilin A)